MSTLTVLAIVAAVFAVPATYNLIRRPDMRRIAVRNIVRRPTESILIIVGSALGTAIIVAALMVGDTFDHSIRDIARTNLGEIDQTIEFESADDLDAALTALNQADIDAVDGVLAIRQVQVAAAGSGTGDDRMVEPRVNIAGVDFDQALTFGSAPDQYGLVGLDQAATVDEIVINDKLADDLGVGIGDPVSLFFGGQETSLTVSSVVSELGLGGYSDAFVTMDLLTAADPAGAETYDHLAVSNLGLVYPSSESSGGRSVADDVTDKVLATLNPTGMDFDYRWVKQDLLDDAESEGEELTQIFSVVGGFSVLAGVLLLINLFVMLAEERKPNLGVLRAIGWRRSALRRAFRAEGVIYAVLAAIAGALLGIGVGWVIVQLTKSILAGANPDSDFELLLSVQPGSLLTAALIGLIIAMGAIWFTSWRISRLNIISAIRDLPEPRTRRSRLLVLGAGVLAVAGGGLMLATGFAADNAFLTIASVPIAVVGIALIAKDVVRPTILGGIGGAITVLWGALFFPLMPDAMTREVEITFFLLFGVVVVAGGVAVTTVLGPWIQKIASSGNRPMVEARVAMAYPSARMFRTAASLAMYSLIIFTLAFMAVLSNSFSLQSTDIAASTAAGHDILVDSNRSNPIPLSELQTLDGVEDASRLIRTDVLFWADFEPGSEDEPDNYFVVGVEPSFAAIGAPTLRDRAARYATDQEALAAVASDPNLIMVPTWFLGDEDGTEPTIGTAVYGQTATADLEFEIVGTIENDYAWSGPWLAAEAIRQLSSTPAETRTYVLAADGVDPTTLADTIEARFLPNGAEAETFTGRVQRFVEADQGFFSLLRGYLLLGLVIGIAGLAVSLFRAVRERRRQIGMMRAMGLASTGVRRWFLTEATFVSLMGIGTGVSLGLLTGYLSTARSTAFEGTLLPFSVPWRIVIFIIAVPFVASALAAIVPARRAAKLRPSEALRLAD